MKPVAYLTLIIFLIISCNQRSASFTKVKAIPKKGSYKIFVQNPANAYLDDIFTDEVKITINKTLQKQGFKLTTDTPKYYFFVHFMIDSSLNSGIAFQGGVKLSAYQYSKFSRSLKVNIWQQFAYSNNIIWQNELQYYFFNQLERDLRRTKSIAKYLVNSRKDDLR